MTATQVEPIAYSQFEQELKAGRIKDIAISNNVIQGSYKEPKADKRTRFVTTRVDPELAKELSRYDVQFTGVTENTFFRDILSWVAPDGPLSGLLNALTFRFLAPIRRLIPPIGGTLDLSALIFIVVAQLILMLPVHWLEVLVSQLFQASLAG